MMKWEKKLSEKIDRVHQFVLSLLNRTKRCIDDIRKSSRVRQHVKQMDDAELAENYPKELLLDIEQKAVELTYSYEFPNGLFRK